MAKAKVLKVSTKRRARDKAEEATVEALGRKRRKKQEEGLERKPETFELRHPHQQNFPQILPGHVEMRSVEFTDKEGRTLRLTVEAEYHPTNRLPPWAVSTVQDLNDAANRWQELLAKQLLEHGRPSVMSELPLIRQLKFSGGK